MHPVSRSDIVSVKAIIFDIDGTLIESMSIDTELYFSSIIAVLGPVRVRKNLDDYEHVTDSGILAQLLDDNGLDADKEIAAAIQHVLVDGINTHIQTTGPFTMIDGALQFVEMARKSRSTRVAFATGSWRKSAFLKLHSAGFDTDGIPVATSDDSPSRIDIMRIALSAIGDDCESVTYFGDAGWDRRACLRLGWNFVAVGSELGGIESYQEIDL